MSMLVNPFVFGMGAISPGSLLLQMPAATSRQLGYQKVNQRNNLGRDVVFECFSPGAGAYGPLVNSVTGQVGTRNANEYIWGPFGPAPTNINSGSRIYNSGVKFDFTQYRRATIAFWGLYLDASNDGCFVVNKFPSPFNGLIMMDPAQSASTFATYMQGLAGGVSNRRWVLPGQKVWHHYAMTFDMDVANSAANTLYVDGKQAVLSSAVTSSWSATDTIGNEKLIFFNRYDEAAQLAGTMQYFAIFRRVLSLNDIGAHMRAPGQIYKSYNNWF
jgi:hypothetical protein